MAILTIQQRMTEVGRIRMGEKVPTQSGGSRPKKLSTFRLTSHSRAYIEAAASSYGGQVTPWDSEQGKQWQVTIEADTLDVVIAPAQAFSQWYELWTGGGCARRCDGITMETVDGKDVREQAVDCMCPSDVAEKVELATKGKACKPTTRLLVWLPKLQGIGVWRAESHGFYSASELPSAVSFLQGLYAQGFRPIAGLRMSTREIKRPGQPPKQFPVLELDLPDTTLSALLAQGMALPGESRPVIGPGAAAALGEGGPAPKQIGAPRSQVSWEGQPSAMPARGEVPIAGGHGEVIEGSAVPATAGPSAPPINQSPTGAPPARGERRPRPTAGTRAELPEASDMRKPAPAQASAPPPPGPAPEPFEEMLPFGQGPDDIVDPLGRSPGMAAAVDTLVAQGEPFTAAQLEAQAELEAIAAEELAMEKQREAIAGRRAALAAPPAAAEPTVETPSGTVVVATGEIVAPSANGVDEGLTPEQFKGMIGAIGAQPRWVVALAKELFPDVSDFRALNDGQRGRLYNEAAIRTEAAAAAGGSNG